MTGSRQGRIVVHVDPDLQEIIPDFFAIRRKDLEKIDLLLQQGDYAGIGRIGHNLKGAGGGYGFDAISEIGQRLEQAADRCAVGEIGLCASELADYIDRVDVCY